MSFQGLYKYCRWLASQNTDCGRLSVLARIVASVVHLLARVPGGSALLPYAVADNGIGLFVASLAS